MRTTPVVFMAVIVALLAFGLFVTTYAYAGQVSLLSTLAVSGVSVVPVHGVGGGHGGGHGGWYGRGYYGGWGSSDYYLNSPSDTGTYQNGNKTCVWNGYKWKCYLDLAFYSN